MSNNYSEQIFQSIDTIISQRLNEVSFDKTEICEIVSQDKDNVNKYWVSNGSLKYEAYSIDENRKYLANQKVYVTIPQGNYDLRKLIIGSYTADETNENLYVNPFNHLVTSSNHEISDIIITTNTSGNSTSNFKDLNISFNYSNTIDFDYIGLEFGLDTSSLQDTYKGTYGIELQIYNNEDKQLNTSRIILYNTDLYGNPYGLIPILKFQHLFPFPKEIKKITDIAKIRVLLAQDGNFEKEGNIKLQDIKLYFGYDTKTITKYELSLILEEGQNLKYTTGETAAARTLYLDWKHFDISNIPHIFNIYQSPNIFDYYKVYWLHYVDGLGKNTDLPDEYAWNWKTITQNINLKQGIILTTLYRTDQYKVVIEYKYKNNETIYYAESTGLVFDNTNVAAEPGATNGSEDSLRIKLNEGDTGVYNIYGLDGRMMDYSYRGPHNIYFDFLDTTPLDRIASINWEFPSENTMIKDVADTDKQQATFNIDTMYKPGAMNNRIWCTVTLVTGEIRRGSLTLQFGEAAAAGSNYAFNIDFKGHRTCLYATGKNDSVEIQAIFTKQNGEVMTVPTITWSWMNDYNSPITLSSSIGEKITLTYNNSKVPKENYSILQAKINDYAIDNGLTTNLTAYLPIPIAKPEYNYISGATRVVYDSNGNTATYSRNPYEIYNLTNKIKGTSWDIISNSTNDTFQLKTQNIRDKNGNIIGEEKTLLPLSYIPQEPPMTCIYCILNGNIVWSQPILIMQNRWEYDLLNEWNGKLNINDQQGYILAPLLGAGKKEGNEFTGVMMGDLKLANGSVTNTGLYGFKEGSRRFSFNDKGEAYIGTGDYYIDFDGEDLNIKAKNFDLNANNRALVISNGEGIKLGDKISLNPNGTAKIGGWQINSNCIHNTTQTGYQVYLWNPAVATGDVITFYNGTTHPFRVNRDGVLYAYGATISGNITAESGKIGGWDINSSELSKTAGDSTVIIKATPYYWHNNNSSTGRAEDVFVVKYQNTYPFSLWKDGTLTATKAIIKGNITAQNGTIGGWTITSDALSCKKDDNNHIALHKPSNWGDDMGAGRGNVLTIRNASKYPFVLMADGSLTATKATIEGNITAQSGTIGGWDINSDRLICKKDDNNFVTLHKPYNWTDMSGGKGDVLVVRNAGAYPFTVYADGSLIATKAEITGTIIAETITATKSGTVAGWSINSATGFKSGNSAINANGTMALYPQVGSGGTILFNNGARISVTAGVAISSNANGAVIAKDSNLDIKACSGSTAYLGCMLNTDGTTERASITCSNGVLRLYSYDRIDVIGTNGSGSTDISDKNKKNSISVLEDNYNVLFDNLLPIKYKYNEGTSDRYHTGFIAQEVSAALDKAKLSTQDFAGLTIQNPNTKDELWGLRYSEFIALNTWQIQKLKTRVTELENEIKEIKQRYEI